MKICSLKIENVRGIASKEFAMDLHPNKPSILVAPNGYGKTSVAVAFKSLKQNKLEIEDEDNRYQNDDGNAPMLEIKDDTDTIYRATPTTNTISDVFSVFVINSQIKPKATTRNLGGYSASTASLAVEPIVLYNTIPVRADFVYSCSDIKSRLGTSAGKLVLNLSQNFTDPDFVKCFLEVKTEIARLLQTRNSAIVDAFLTEINSISGTKQVLANTAIDLSRIMRIEAVTVILDKFDYLFTGLSDNEKVVNAIQLRKVYEDNSTGLSNISKYYEYLSDKNAINEMLGFFNCTWKDIKASVKGSKYIIDFPKANQISNGERDVLCFIGKLFEAQTKLKKEKAILIIDEIFDYLDDANLISAQYFLTKFINQFREARRELFPIILTHLDPAFFSTYSFSTKNVIYLDRVHQMTNKYCVNNFLKDRENCKKNNPDSYNLISSNYLHYSPVNCDESAYLRPLGVETPLLKSDDFQNTTLSELENYKKGQPYDLALVCCGLRIFIEKQAYDQLQPTHQSEFLTIFKTINKLSYAKEKGASVPEVHFLLSIIYNEAMHLDPQCQKLHPIGYKLKNKVIHNMICEAG